MTYSSIVKSSIEIVRYISSMFIFSNDISDGIVNRVMPFYGRLLWIEFPSPFQSVEKLGISFWENKFAVVRRPCKSELLRAQEFYDYYIYSRIVVRYRNTPDF